MTDKYSSKHAWLGGQFATGHLPAYLWAGEETSYNIHAFTQAYSDDQIDNISAYLTGNVLYTSSFPGYVSGGGGLITSSLSAFIGTSVVRSSVSARFGGDGTGAIVVERNYIELETSDSSIKKRFRVLAQGYDDGTLNKAEKLDRTIGGGYDHSLGAIYEEWNPVIRVRHTEEDSNYGTLQELRDFYEYNDPGGSITPDITLYDHLNQSHTVHMVGSFRKQLLGTKVEGTSAWYIVSLKLVAV